MTKKILFAGGLILWFSLLALAATKPSFTGTWAMDRARSFGLPANMNQILTITHSEDRIELETKLVQPGNERVVKDTYVLDGKEYEFTPQASAGQPPAKGKRTASWLPGGNGLTVTEVTTSESPKGQVTTQVVRKWTISSVGELIIDMYVDNPNISYETKRIFKKQ